MNIDFDSNDLRVTDGMGRNQSLEGVHKKLWESTKAGLDAVPMDTWRLSTDACSVNEAALILETDRASRDPHFIVTFDLVQGLHTPTVELIAGKDAIDANLGDFAARISPDTQDTYHPVAFAGGNVTALYQNLSARLAEFHTQQAGSLEPFRFSREWT